MSTSKIRKRGVSLQGQFQEAIFLMFKHFLREKKAGHVLGDITQPVDRISDILKVSHRSIRKTIRLGKRGAKFTTPNKFRKRCATVTNVDSFSKDVISRIIYKKHEDVSKVTLEVLHQEAVSSGEYAGSLSSFRTVIREMGFRWQKADTRALLMEKADVQLKRFAFLREYINNMRADVSRTPVFLDETWIFLNGSQQKTWTNVTDSRTIPKRMQGDGKRFIVLHAGTKFGYVPGCSLLFSTKNPKLDYHGDMDSDNFSRWVETQLLPGLEVIKDKGPFMIVMDNAPYHSRQIDKQPTTSWKKEDLREWLVSHGVAASETLYKKELMVLANQHKSSLKRYEIDELLEKHGHSVLRLPPYHCQYNAIELVWANAKPAYNKAILDRTIHPECDKKDAKTRAVWADALSKVTCADWEANVRHVEAEITKDWEKEVRFERDPQAPICINLQADSDTESESDVDGDLESAEDDEPLAVPLSESTSELLDVEESTYWIPEDCPDVYIDFIPAASSTFQHSTPSTSRENQVLPVPKRKK